jgi:hypothetical protein
MGKHRTKKEEPIEEFQLFMRFSEDEYVVLFNAFFSVINAVEGTNEMLCRAIKRKNMSLYDRTIMRSSKRQLEVGKGSLYFLIKKMAKEQIKHISDDPERNGHYLISSFLEHIGLREYR